MAEWSNAFAAHVSVQLSYPLWKLDIDSINVDLCQIIYNGILKGTTVGVYIETQTHTYAHTLPYKFTHT